jgi:cytosol aminopeptidase
MSSSAYVVPYDHQNSDDFLPGHSAAKLWATTPQGDTPPKAGTTRTFFNAPETKLTTVSSLGDKFSSKSQNAKRELVRKAVGSAVKELKAMDGVKDVAVDASLDPHAAGTQPSP